MTEDELRAIPQFGELPIYDETDDEGCRTLTNPHLAYGFHGLIEASDRDEFNEFLKKPKFKVKGAIRSSPKDVRAIFWQVVK